MTPGRVGDDRERRAPAGVDITRPNIARVYDHLIGGKDNFAVDRAEAARLLAVSPRLARLARDNRRFLGQAVRWVAAQGVRQFLDLGAGLPTGTSTHQAAQSVDPDVRVVYVDHDPMVVVHGTALLTGDGSTAVARADISRPRAVLTHPDVQALLDLSQPTAVIAAMVLHFFPAGQARAIMATLAAALAPGSYLIVSAGCGVPEVGDQLVKEYEAGPLHNHSPGQIATFFAGADLMTPPGLAFAGDWEPGTVPPPPRLTGIHVLAGVARLPPAPGLLLLLSATRAERPSTEACPGDHEQRPGAGYHGGFASNLVLLFRLVPSCREVLVPGGCLGSRWRGGGLGRAGWCWRRRAAGVRGCGGGCGARMKIARTCPNPCLGDREAGGPPPVNIAGKSLRLQ
ncbi:MAG TPA: SAM-dependent methyltransferase [Trebonia sp.]|nr:SAM-dependent methyltransferase [Trebonia sp.]